MVERKFLIEARKFFDNESDEYQQEMEIESFLVDIACEFIKYRDKNKLTQKDLAEKLHMTQAMISKLESGDYNPSVKLLFEIAQKLSWNIKIEFSEVAEKVDYQYKGNELAMDNCYIADMGFAS